MKVLDSINNLEEYKIKSMIYNGIDTKSGQNYQTSESGVEFNVISYVKHKHTLTLQHLTGDEVREIAADLYEAKRSEDEVTISKSLLLKRKYLDMKPAPGEPILRFETKNVKPKSEGGTEFYGLVLKLTERVDY